MADQERQGKKMPWCEREDQLLRSIVGEELTIPWAAVAQELNNKLGGATERTGKQCRERWRNHLDPDINKFAHVGLTPDRDPWNDQDDIVLLSAFLEHRNKWSDIGRLLNGRSENAVKNRFNILMKRHKQDGRTGQPTELGKALQAISTSIQDDVCWIVPLIEAKKRAATGSAVDAKPAAAVTEGKVQPSPAAEAEKEKEKEMETVTRKTEKICIEEHKGSPARKIQLMLREEAVKGVLTNPGDYSCPNPRLIERVRKRDMEVRRNAVRFVNPETQQEMYVTSDCAVYINDPRRGIVKLKNFSQIVAPTIMTDDLGIVRSPKNNTAFP